MFISVEGVPGIGLHPIAERISNFIVEEYGTNSFSIMRREEPVNLEGNEAIFSYLGNIFSIAGERIIPAINRIESIVYPGYIASFFSYYYSTADGRSAIRSLKSFKNIFPTISFLLELPACEIATGILLRISEEKSSFRKDVLKRWLCNIEERQKNIYLTASELYDNTIIKVPYGMEDLTECWEVMTRNIKKWYEKYNNVRYY